MFVTISMGSIWRFWWQVARCGDRRSPIGARNGAFRVEAADTGVIIPRKGVLELSRLLDGDAPLELAIGSNHLRAANEQFTFTSS